MMSIELFIVIIINISASGEVEASENMAEYIQIYMDSQIWCQFVRNQLLKVCDSFITSFDLGKAISMNYKYKNFEMILHW